MTQEGTAAPVTIQTALEAVDLMGLQRQNYHLTMMVCQARRELDQLRLEHRKVLVRLLNDERRNWIQATTETER